MRITYVVREHSYNGGTDRVLSRKANYLVKAGYQVSIITSESAGSVPFFYFDPLITFYYLGVDDKEVNRDIYLSKLNDCLLAYPTDISISTGLGLTKYLCEATDGSKKILEFHFSKYKGKTFFAKWDSYFIGRFLSSIYSRKETRLANRYEKFVVLTNEDKELWRGVHDITVIPNPITIEPTIASELLSKRVIAVGRYTGQKGFDRLVRVWSKVKDVHPDWKLSIFGDGKYRKRLEGYIHNNDLSTVVELLPPTKDITSEFLKSSIFVMTSRYEGQPLVLIEAMSAGLPAVCYTFKCGAKETIRDNEDGFLVEEGNVSDFVNRLSLLMNDDVLRKKMGEKAYSNIQRYREECIMPLWTSLFESMTIK